MARKFLAFFLVFAAIAGWAGAEKIDRAALFSEIGRRYSGETDLSGRLETNMNVVGMKIKIPARFWYSGEKMRMDMEIAIPGMDKPMKQVILVDGEEFIQFNEAMNMVMKADLTKLSEDVRARMRGGRSFMFAGAEELAPFAGMEEEVNVEKKTEEGKDYFVITVKDLNKLGNVPQMGGVQAPEMFQKAAFIIDGETLFLSRIEFYGQDEAPGMWIDFSDISTDKVPAETFNLKIPENAVVNDITEMMKNMIEGAAQ